MTLILIDIDRSGEADQIESKQDEGVGHKKESRAGGHMLQKPYRS